MCYFHRVRGGLMKRLTMLALATATIAPVPLMAHPGGLNSEGCHNNRRTGDYHCHRGPGAAEPRSRPAGVLSAGGGVFRNCTVARAAGAAPVRRGEPGYGPHLDRDGDGVGCE